MSVLMALTVLEKTANESLPLGMDFTDWLISGESLSSVTSVTSVKMGGGTSDLTIGSPSIVTGDIVSFNVSGGSNGTRYRVIVKVVTSSSSILEGVGMLKVGNG